MELFINCIVEHIFKVCKESENKVLLQDIKGKKITWKQFLNYAISTTLILHQQGLKRGDKVVIFVKDNIDFAIFVFASILLDLKIFFIEDYSYPILEEKLKVIKPDFVIIENIINFFVKIPIVKNLKKISKYKLFYDFSKKVISADFLKQQRKIDISEKIIFKKSDIYEDRFIVFTSWTTSNPKWVVHTLENIHIMFLRLKKIIWNNSKIFYADLPHFVLMGIYFGVKTIVWEVNLIWNKFKKVLEMYQVDTIFSPPYRFSYFVNNKENLPKSLRKIFLGSAPVYQSFLEKLLKLASKNTQIVCIYGMTEILPIAIIDAREKIKLKSKGDILGELIEGLKLEVWVDWELVISWKWIFTRYLNKDKVSKVFTGDIVRIQNWIVEMMGRKKDMIIKKDYNIYPSLYENLILSLPNIEEVALVGIYDEILNDEKIILYIKWNKINLGDICEKLKHIIDFFAIPDEIICLKSLPKIGRQQKIDKNNLRNNYDDYVRKNCGYYRC